MKGELKFDEGKHQYTVNGLVLPSVTQVLADLNDFSSVPPDVLEEARNRGDHVHKATELLDRDELDLGSVHQAWRPYVDAWQRFTQAGPEFFGAIEHRSYHRKLMYAGTCDRIMMDGDKIAIVEIKTYHQISPVDALQTAAYAAIAEQDFRVKVSRRLTVHLKPDGTYAVVEWKDKSDFAVFCACLTRYQWIQQRKK